MHKACKIFHDLFFAYRVSNKNGCSLVEDRLLMDTLYFAGLCCKSFQFGNDDVWCPALTWYLPILLTPLYYMEIVSCGLWADSHARKVTLKQISDQKYFSFRHNKNISVHHLAVVISENTLHMPTMKHFLGLKTIFICLRQNDIQQMQLMNLFTAQINS